MTGVGEDGSLVGPQGLYPPIPLGGTTSTRGHKVLPRCWGATERDSCTWSVSGSRVRNCRTHTTPCGTWVRSISSVHGPKVLDTKPLESTPNPSMSHGLCPLSTTSPVSDKRSGQGSQRRVQVFSGTKEKGSVVGAGGGMYWVLGGLGQQG